MDCFLINISWRSDVAILVGYCSPDIEYLILKCRPYYLPCQFTCTILTVVYAPLHAEVKSEFDVVYNATNTLRTEYPKALFSVAGDFNQANFNKMKELVIAIRKQSGGHTPVCINGDEVEMFESIKFMVVMITSN
eukprot:g32337.t1